MTRPKHTDGTPMMSLNEAAAWGITHLREPKWANPRDHIVQVIHEGRPAPWLSLYCPFNIACNGADPVKILAIAGPGLCCDPEEVQFVPYYGPRFDSPEYQADVATFAAQP